MDKNNTVMKKVMSIAEAIEVVKKEHPLASIIEERKAIDKIRAEKYKDKKLEDLTIGDEIVIGDCVIAKITGLTEKEIVVEDYDVSGDNYGSDIQDLRYCRKTGKNLNEDTEWFSLHCKRGVSVMTEKDIKDFYISFLKRQAQIDIKKPHNNSSEEDIIEYIYFLLLFSKESMYKKEPFYIGEPEWDDEDA
jgi:hypothetical protein